MHNIEAISMVDLDAIADTMVASFISDPTVRFSYPEPTHYLSAFKALSRLYFEGAVKHGTAWKICGNAGAIACFPPGESADKEAILGYIKRTCHPDSLKDLMAAAVRLESCQPQEPHWNIGMIGVDPLVRGKELGRELLNHAIKLIDKEGMPAYFESSNPQNIIRYEMLGFKAVDKLYLGGKIIITPLIRPAQ